MFCKVAEPNGKTYIDNICFSADYHELERSAMSALPPLAASEWTARSSTQSKDEPMTHTAVPNEIDVRSLVPMQRHQKIFQLVDELAPGGKFVLINDHDPKPLYYQLEAEHPRQFSWTYLERGPEVWRVEIGRLSKAA
jgi:uncharacterized protein (DUF2249 family)